MDPGPLSLTSQKAYFICGAVCKSVVYWAQLSIDVCIFMLRSLVVDIRLQLWI